MPFDVEKTDFGSHVLYTLVFHGTLDITDFNNFKKCFNECLQGKSFGAIFNLKNIDSAPPNLVMAQATYMREYESFARQKLIATAILIDSPTLQNLLKGLFMVKSPIAPNIVTGNIAEGTEFIDDYVQLFKIEQRKALRSTT